MKYAGINKSIKTSDFLTGNDTDKNRQSSEGRSESVYQEQVTPTKRYFLLRCKDS